MAAEPMRGRAAAAARADLNMIISVCLAEFPADGREIDNLP